MKIKNLKYTLEALTLAVTLSMTGLENYTIVHAENHKEISTESNKTYDEKELLSKSDIKDLIVKINKCLGSRYECMLHKKTLYIYENPDVKRNTEIDISAYSSINLLLAYSNIDTLKLDFCGKEDVNIDFSNIGVSNIDVLEISNANINNVMPIINRANNNNVKIYYTLDNEKFKYESKVTLESFAYNNIKLEGLSLAFSDFESFEFIEDTIEQLDVKNLNLFIDKVENELNVNVKLHDNTETFSISSPFDVVKLNEFNVSSNSKEALLIGVDGIIIDDDTKFNIDINDYGINLFGECSSTLPLKALNKCNYFYYYDINSNEYVVYESTTDDDFKKIIEDIKTTNKNEKIK